METYDDLGDSLPYIDDIPTDDDSNPHPYNLSIHENYQNKNRNIEIINRFPEDGFCKSLSPVAPLAEESDISDQKTDEKPDKKVEKTNGMRLVIKGWNSSISIQGLDNRSSITFKRTQHKVHRKEDRKEKSQENSKPPEKSRKGRWKMLTRSLITKSGAFDRRGLDERYPKYVLLQNEDEDATKVKESYPKMFVFKEKNSGSRKQKENMETKCEFNFKKSFKNKTKPMDENLAKKEEAGTDTKKKPLTERSVSVRKRNEKRKSLAPQPVERSPPHGQVFNEIQGIFQDTLNLCQGGPVEDQQKKFPQFSCHDPFCWFVNQPPNYNSVYNTHPGPVHSYKNSNTQTNEPGVSEEASGEDIDLKNLPFGILSSFFPRVVIMKSFQTDEEPMKGIDKEEDYQYLETAVCDNKHMEEPKPIETLEVPLPDLTIKSKMVQDPPQPEFYHTEISEVLSSDEEHRTKTDDSEATEYLHYCETEQLGNESVDRPATSSPPPKYEDKGKQEKKLLTLEKITEEEDNSKNLSLTKIGYKMYDNLTKLSLNREKEIIEQAEVNGCGCNGNETKKSPYNITLESNNGVVKVTVPENELNFQIVNSQGADIQIGLAGGSKRDGGKEKKTVRKEELWHPEDGRKALILAPNDNITAKGSQKVKVSLADSKDVLLSIEMGEREQKTDEKATKEKKIGTDDFDLAGGDFVCTLGETYRNLSPRTGQLLKNLQEKLELGERERQFLAEKIKEKITDEKFQGRILPGVFLLKQISPRPNFARKPLPVPSKKKSMAPDTKDPGGQLREYYCEECLATMRIFEDENPSVKSMVDKFETIIQLESY